MHYEFAVLGIDGWIDWPLDRVKLFLIEKSERDAERMRQAQQLESKRGKRFPGYIFTLPIP